MTNVDEYVASGAFGGGRDGEQDGEQDDGGDAKRLILFLKTLDSDLREMIADAEFLPDSLRVQASQAYALGGAPNIGRMIEMLAREWTDWLPGLEQHGLTGLQLDFKLTVHGSARETYQFYRTPAEGPEIVVDPRGRRTRPDALWADEAARDYLACSDIILESLSGALGGAGAAVIEIKKMIEWLKGAGWGFFRRAFGIR